MTTDGDALAWRLAEAIAWWRFREQSSDPAYALGEPEALPPLPVDEFREARDALWQKGYRLFKQGLHMSDADNQEYARLRAPLDERRRIVGEILAREHRRLRSIALQPLPRLDDEGRFNEWQVEDSAAALLQTAATRRASLLREVGAYPAAAATDLAGGRIVTYVPRESLSDGAAEVSSEEFFNYYDEPTWDLWLHFADSQLYSWVPADMIENVEQGIWASSVGNIGWASEEEARLFVAGT